MNGNFLLFGSPATPSSFMMTQNSQQDLSKYHSLPFQVSICYKNYSLSFSFSFLFCNLAYMVFVYII